MSPAACMNAWQVVEPTKRKPCPARSFASASEAGVRAGTAPVVQSGGLAETARAMTGERRYVSLVPTQLVRLLDEHGPDLHALTTFDAVLVGGGPLDPDVRSRAERGGVRVVQTYGMSETCGGCVYDGHPLPGVGVRIASDGEVELTGPVLFDGYVLADGSPDHERTARVLREGWLRTDDLGTIDERGYVRVTGRAKEMIIRGGENIAPKAVEDAIRLLPEILDVAVVGVPDKKYGEQVCAYVRLHEGSSLTLERLRAELADQVARFKLPAYLRVIDDFPKTPSGKIQKFRLVEMFTDDTPSDAEPPPTAVVASQSA